MSLWISRRTQQTAESVKLDWIKIGENGGDEPKKKTGQQLLLVGSDRPTEPVHQKTLTVSKASAIGCVLWVRASAHAKLNRRQEDGGGG